MEKGVHFPTSECDRPRCSPLLFFPPCFYFVWPQRAQSIHAAVRHSHSHTLSPVAIPPVTPRHLRLRDAVHPCGRMTTPPGWEHKQQHGTEHYAGLPLPDSFLPTVMHPLSTTFSWLSPMCKLARVCGPRNSKDNRFWWHIIVYLNPLMTVMI